ncbi:synaptotagmin-13 [Rhinophrynus dorsalis]
MGATLGAATGFIALCVFIAVCTCLQRKKFLPEEGKGTPVTMTNVFQPGQAMSIYKCTEPVQPQTKLSFPHIYNIKQTCPKIINYQDYAKKMEDDEKKRMEKPQENSQEENISDKLISDKSNQPLEQEKEDNEKVNGWNHIPKLRYSLGYERQTSELCVSFLEAVGSLLPGEEDSGSHSYVVGTLTTSSGQTEAQTSLVKRSPHTIWEEALLFPLKDEERGESNLTLTLRHCDRFSRHLVAGEITLSLANIGVPFGTARWVDLRAPEKEMDSTGEVLLSVSYLPAANRLIVVLIKARNIHSDQYNNLLGKDLSVKVVLKHQSQKLKKKQTKRVKHKINPVWNEMIMFEVPLEALGEVSVDLQMLCQEPAGSGNRVLGACCLGAEQTGTGKSHWLEMMNNHRRQIAMWHSLHP